MQILVTGGAGYIASNLIKSLKEKYFDCEIISLDNYSSGFESNHVEDVRYIKDNTWNISKIEELQNFNPEWVFHFGEFSRVVLSFDKPNETFHSNTYGTQQILNYCVNKKSKLIYSGSSAIFGNNGEDKNLNPYAWTKSSNIELIKNYANWFGLNYSLVYFYNVFGKNHITSGEYATVIGIFEKQYKNNEPLTIVEPGTQSRCFTYIDDIVDGIIIVAEKGNGDGYYLSSNIDLTIFDVAKMFNHPYVFIEKKRGERTSSDIKISRAETELGWKANTQILDYIKSISKV